MSTIELVTVTISSIAIGAAVVSIVLFVVYGMLQKRMILRPGENTKVPEETALVMQLFAESLKDELPDNDREVLKSIVERYSETSLTGVLDDSTERLYLFEGLADPSRLPWGESGEQQQGRSK